MLPLRAIAFLTFGLLSVSVITAQSACVPGELLALGRTASTCARLDYDQLCYGNGSASATISGDGSFVQPGDIVELQGLSTIQTTQVDNEIATAILALKPAQGVDDPQNTVFWLLGDVTLENLVPYPVLVAVETTANAKLRRTPIADGDIVEEVVVGTLLEASAISLDGNWLRVVLPNSTEQVWVNRDVTTAIDSLANLTVTDTAEVLEQAFSQVTLQVGASTYCGGQLTSGVFIQSPSATPFELQMNDLALKVQGTLFVTMQADELVIYSLAGGTTRTSENSNFPIPMGTVYRAGETIPYTSDEVIALPTNSLPFRVTIAEPASEEDLPQLLQPIVPTLTPELMPIATPRPDTTCRYTTETDTTARLGPALFYEASGDIERDTLVDPMRSTLDPNGDAWYQLRDSRWVIVEDVIVTGICPELAQFVDVPPPPTNRLIMETCQSTNGPLRSGQSVTIEFLPPPFESYQAAILATQVDPGRVKIGINTVRPYASEPILFSSAGEQRYAIRFSAIWKATPGNYRIEIDRVEYELICQVVVPSGG